MTKKPQCWMSFEVWEAGFNNLATGPCTTCGRKLVKKVYVHDLDTELNPTGKLTDDQVRRKAVKAGIKTDERLCERCYEKRFDSEDIAAREQGLHDALPKSRPKTHKKKTSGKNTAKKKAK